MAPEIERAIEFSSALIARVPDLGWLEGVKHCAIAAQDARRTLSSPPRQLPGRDHPRSG